MVLSYFELNDHDDMTTSREYIKRIVYSCLLNLQGWSVIIAGCNTTRNKNRLTIKVNTMSQSFNQ